MSDEGMKFDAGKVRWDLLPMGALEEVAKVYTFGSVKYEPWNWRKGLAFSRCAAALMRHWFAWWWKGETHDAETGCHHLASCTFYLLNFMTYEHDRRNDLDDRPSRDSASQTPAPTRSQTPSHAAWQEALRKFDRFAPENCSTAPPLLDQMEDSTSS